MGFFDIAKKVAKGTVDVIGAVADKAAEMKAKAKKRQEEVMVDKSDDELKKLSSDSGINGMAARMELKDREL